MNYVRFIATLLIVPFGISRAGIQQPVADADLSVKQWPGHVFIILPKQKISRAFGYELYLTPQLDCSKSKPDSARETATRRVRCDKFAGSCVVAKEVRISGKEFLVHFIHKPTGGSLFGRTRRGAIEGLALADDLVGAQRRWLGKTVYSMRRFINLYDSVTGNLKTQKVRITDPLKVVELRWGTTPLPSQPLWLIVESAGGVRGFIPVRISRTNALADVKTTGLPWDEDVLEQDPKKLYSWDEVAWEAIDNHSILPRMTKSQIRLSWGEPKTVRGDTRETKGEHWLFDNDQELYFIGDTLVSVNDHNRE